MTDVSGWADPSIPTRQGDPPERVLAATEPPDRAPALEIRSTHPPSRAIAGTSRPETLVHGSLFDLSHAAIQGASSAGVSFVDHTGRRRSANARQKGAYALHALEFGRYWVTASADGYRSLEETVDLRPDRSRMRKDFALQRAVQLRVRVTTPEGMNLFDVLKAMGTPMGARLLVPVATREPPGQRFDEVVGSLNGKSGVGQFQNYGPRVEGLSPGCMGILLLDCDLPVHVSLLHHNLVLQTKRVDSGQDEVTFVVAPADLLAALVTIRMQVIDAETRLPIQGARVMLWGGSHSDPGVATDPRGIATIDRREPGLFDLQVWARGYEKFRKPIDALPGEIADLGTVALEKEVTVEGRVLDLEGYPLAASFSLGILDPVDHSVCWLQQQGFKSRGDGSFDIRGLGRKEYVLRTTNHDAVDRGGWEGIALVSGNLIVDTRAGSISSLEIHLRPATRLVLHAVAPGTADGMLLRVVDERGVELVGCRLPGSKPRSLLLPAGNYRVCLLDQRGAVLSERFITLGSETVKVDLPRKR